jgi:hypothetical protein
MASRISFLLRALPVLSLAVVIACKPDAGAKRARWNAAVGRGSGVEAWHVLDAGTRRRIVAGLERSQSKAKTDPAFQRLFAGVCAPADSAQPAETLAQALLSNPELALPADESAQEAWPPELVGFCAPDGCPLTLAIRTHPPLAPPAGTSYHLFVDPDGKTVEEVHQLYANAIRTLAPAQHWSPAHAAQATRILNLYFDELIPRGAFKVTFDVEGDGGLTTVFESYDRSTRRTEAVHEPRLAYGSWP